MRWQLNKKKDNEVIDLVDDIVDYDNQFKDTFKADPEDIFIDDNLIDDFDHNNKKDIKMVCDDILKDENLNQNDVLFEEIPKRPLKLQIIRANKKFELAANKIKKKYSNPTKKSQNPLDKKVVEKSRVS